MSHYANLYCITCNRELTSDNLRYTSAHYLTDDLKILLKHVKGILFLKKNELLSINTHYALDEEELAKHDKHKIVFRSEYGVKSYPDIPIT